MPIIRSNTAPAGGLAPFLKMLAEEGRATVAPGPVDDDHTESLAELTRIDRLAREALALDVPRMSPDVALWAARLFYHLCQFAVYRDLGPEQIAAALVVPAPERLSPAAAWSADLTLRHLPKLHQLARHLCEADPLLEALREVGMNWPLSSVGLPGLNSANLHHDWLEHPALLRLYVDRITAAKDTSRLAETRVARQLQIDLGIHQELAPEIAATLALPQS